MIKSIKFLLFLFLIIFLCQSCHIAFYNPFSDSFTGEFNSWWDTDWNRRIKLIFKDSTYTDLNNFPLLVILNPSRVDCTSFKAGGSDIRFVDMDNKTDLAYEIEEWNNSGNSYIWVNVPLLPESSDSDYIWMYYDNENAGDAQNPAALWDGYVNVWHLNESGTDERIDSINICNATTNNYDGDEAVAGFIAGADDLDGIDDHLTALTSVVPNTEGTIEMWVKPHFSSGSHPDCNLIRVNLKEYIYMYMDGNDMKFGWYGENYLHPPDSALNWVADEWHYVAVVFGNSDVKETIYIDGFTNDLLEDWSNEWGPDQVTMGQGVFIGVYKIAPATDCFNGTIDEVRISGKAHSASWIMTQYLSMTDNIITYGSEEIYPDGSEEIYPDGSEEIYPAW